MERNNYKSGLICALACTVIWGLLPIYWDALNPIGSAVIIFYRIVLMGLICFAAAWFQKRNIKAVFAPMFEDRKKMWVYILAGLVITANWSIYIWAVTAGYVIQTSMGYFIEPLIVCLFGIVIYKEKANKWKLIALGFGISGLLVMIIGYRELPLIAIGLSSTFSVYAAIKKSVKLPALQSLLYETLFLVPIALCVVIYLEFTGAGALAVADTGKYILLLFAGLATAVPMGLFSSAAPKLPMLTMGLIQYISPSIALLLGIFLFHEPFDQVQFTAFVIIWIGLVFFTYGEFKEMKQAAKK